MPLQNSHQTQGANFLALPSVLDQGQSPCGAHLTLSLLPLQNILRTVQKTAFFVLKGRSNKKQPAPTSVGANNFWSRSVNYCKEFPNRFSFNPILVLPSCHKDKFFRDQVDRCRGPGIVKERSYSGSQSFRPGLLQPFISCSKERGHLPARDRFEFIKPFCSPRSFSDGGAPLFKDRSQERGPHDKYRSKRRIFFRSPLAPKGSSNPAHTNPEGPPVRLQLSSISQSPVSSRANLVAKQFTQGQRQPCFSPTTESHNSLRCFNARLACHVSGQVHKRQMVQSGINPAHQPPGIKSSISCPQNIPQGPVSQGCSIEVGQLHGSSLSQQQRRHPLSSSDVLNSGNLDMMSSKKHLNFSTACSWKRKYCSRLRVSYLPRLNRLATRSNGNHTLPYKLEHGSFRQPLNSTATPIFKGLRVSMVALESLVC